MQCTGIFETGQKINFYGILQHFVSPVRAELEGQFYITAPTTQTIFDKAYVLSFAIRETWSSNMHVGMHPCIWEMNMYHILEMSCLDPQLSVIPIDLSKLCVRWNLVWGHTL